MSEKYKMDDPEGIYFLTMTVVNWIDLYTRKELKHVVVDALNYCQKNKGLTIHAWCLMPSHLHLIVSSEDQNLASLIRDFKKFTSKALIAEFDHYYESRKEWLLAQFQEAGRSLKRIQKYKLWQDDNRPKQLLTNGFMQQKLDYIHMNPVVDEIVDRPEDYLYSSAKDYTGERGMIDLVMIN